MNEFLEGLKILKESEDHIEFKEAKNDFNYNGGDHNDPKKRRHCVLGYVAALANEGGGRLMFGMKDNLGALRMRYMSITVSVSGLTNILMATSVW